MRRPDAGSGTVTREPGQAAPGVAADPAAQAGRAPVAPPHAGRRMVPDYLIIGVKRGGTTSLAEYLFQHPDVLPPVRAEGRPLLRRELRSGLEAGTRRTSRPRPRPAGTRAHRVRPVTGDSSPYIIFHPLALERVRLHLPDGQARAVAARSGGAGVVAVQLRGQAGLRGPGHPRPRSTPSPSGWRARRNGCASRPGLREQGPPPQRLPRPGSLRRAAAARLRALPARAGARARRRGPVRRAAGDLRRAHRLPRPAARAAHRPAGLQGEHATSRSPTTSGRAWRPTTPSRTRSSSSCSAAAPTGS